MSDMQPTLYSAYHKEKDTQYTYRLDVIPKCYVQSVMTKLIICKHLANFLMLSHITVAISQRLYDSICIIG